jgi:hypothetical protein
MMDTFPDLGSLSRPGLKDLIQAAAPEEEQEVSYQRRILHGKIDILRAELVNRLRKKREAGEDVLSGADVQKALDILAGPGSGGDESSAPWRPLPECGSSREGRTTAASAARVQRRSRRKRGGDHGAYHRRRDGELRPVDVGRAPRGRRAGHPPGGGRVGSRSAAGERVDRRSPDATCSSTDVTVSRDTVLCGGRAPGSWTTWAR